jgi:hypothetical protein
VLLKELEVLFSINKSAVKNNYWITIACSIGSIVLFLARSFALYFRFLGLVRSLYPQHGHHSPSHFMKISHIWQRFWPLAYRPEPTGFWALCLIQIPLHVILENINK